MARRASRRTPASTPPLFLQVMNGYRPGLSTLHEGKLGGFGGGGWGGEMLCAFYDSPFKQEATCNLGGDAALPLSTRINVNICHDQRATAANSLRLRDSHVDLLVVQANMVQVGGEARKNVGWGGVGCGRGGGGEEHQQCKNINVDTLCSLFSVSLCLAYVCMAARVASTLPESIISLPIAPWIASLNLDTFKLVFAFRG